MPTGTARPSPPPPQIPPSPLPGADRSRLGRVAIAAGAFAALELLLGVYVGGHWASQRAEALPFILSRPWLLIAGALAAAPLPLRARLLGYALFLAAAGLNESVYMLRLGNPDPWPEMLRGIAAAIVLLALLDLAVQPARRRFGRWGGAAAALLAAGLFALPGALSPYRALVAAEAPPRQAGAKPGLTLMTALPIVWGEGGAFDPASRPAASYRALQEEFRISLLDALDAEALAGSRLLLLAQPRLLAPAELVALDAWVRGGGRALILTDPALDWPSDLPLGDIRRPPPAGLLEPLLDHWGLELEPSGRRGGLEWLERRMVALRSPGRFSAAGTACAVRRAFLAECRIGRGRALLLADADLMHDSTWVGPGSDGDSRYRRLADNPLVLADLLDGLAGIDRPRARDAIRWRNPDAPRGRLLLTAVLAPLGAGAGIWLALLLMRRRGE